MARLSRLGAIEGAAQEIPVIPDHGGHVPAFKPLQRDDMRADGAASVLRLRYAPRSEDSRLSPAAVNTGIRCIGSRAAEL